MKTFKVTIAQENHFYLATVTVDHNHHISSTLENNWQIEKTAKSFNKIGTAIQVVTIANTGTVTQDQINIDVIAIEIIQIKNLISRNYNDRSPENPNNYRNRIMVIKKIKKLFLVTT